MGFEVEEVWRSTETKAGAGRDEMRERVRRLLQATADEAGWSPLPDRATWETSTVKHVSILQCRGLNHTNLTTCCSGRK